MEALCYTGFINEWFIIFKKYCSNIYGGRNINIDDFFENPFNLVKTDKFDIIILATVFEHLDEPLINAKEVCKHLKKGGILLFDYILSDADGLDTIKGLEKREETIKYLFEKFEINKKMTDYLNETLLLTSATKK